MAIPIRVAHQAIPHRVGRVGRRAIPSRVAQPVIRPGVLQPAMRSSASRPITSAPERTVRMRTVPESGASWLTPSAVITVVTIGAGVAAIIMVLQSTIKDGNSALEGKLTATSSALQVELAKLDASNRVLQRELAASNREQAASISVLKTELTANTASSRELKSVINTKLSEVNTKLDSVSANLQAQQVQTANLKGQVTILREGDKKK